MVERSHVSANPAGTGGGQGATTLTLQRHWEEAEVLPVEGADAPGHGGGDERLLADLFGETLDDTLGRPAGSAAGAWALITGVAANRSFATGVPVATSGLVPSLSSGQ